jgi:transcription-repair coupling factor (superfamily II helicase)
VPEVKFVTAHGQMSAGELEDKMSAFYEGQYDVLLATAIVESGLDIPRANTLIVYRADLFGLAQLYQLRGRVGRSKTRAYALFTLPANRPPTAQAEKRLKVLQSLDTLGAGFELASHDLDIRGAGNLLGDEQSGHIKEVGFELYQQMLREAIEALQAGVEDDAPAPDTWSPSITLGLPVTIPEHYVPDIGLRMTLYRRLSSLEDEAEVETFGAELIDRFGAMPDEVRQLLKLMQVKGLCRRANVERVDAGPKGVIIGFRDGAFADPNGLVRLIQDPRNEAKVRPDMRVAFMRDFEDAQDRLDGTRVILRMLVGLAEKKVMTPEKHLAALATGKGRAAEAATPAPAGKTAPVPAKPAPAAPTKAVPGKAVPQLRAPPPKVASGRKSLPFGHAGPGRGRR